MRGVLTSLETMKYLTSNDCLIDKGQKYFEVESINTNEDTRGQYFKENRYLKEKTMNARLNK